MCNLNSSAGRKASILIAPKKCPIPSPVEGQERVYVPGEQETAFEKENMQNGISLLQPVVEDLEKLGERFEVKL